MHHASPRNSFCKTLLGQNINANIGIFIILHSTDLFPCNVLAFQKLKISVKGSLTENIQGNMKAVPNGL